ncbi:uncharacterized protein LOC121386703 [Gigantopelta aegis]|uniref:uncharacterized protein LOC121386703 n=1 Tax=Gigantopelta aegis TaxID=1735272 RepID=UPI001B88D06F|nr:uncharacterized protein LOC121386703 [Gigantopelta aegis]
MYQSCSSKTARKKDDVTMETTEKPDSLKQEKMAKPTTVLWTKTRHSNRKTKKVKTENDFLKDTSWTLTERKQLLDAFLQSCNPDDFDSLAVFIPTKSKKQIEQEIVRIKAGTFKAEGRKKDKEIMDATTTIDPWLNLAEDIVFYDSIDHSSGIARVMGVAGKYEHATETVSKKRPSYRRLYRYIAATLRGGDLPDLTPVENAVMLELLKGVTQKLTGCDTTDKEKVLTWKYARLKAKYDINRLPQIVKGQNKAFLNEFPEEFGLNSDGRRRKKGTAETVNPSNVNPSSDQSVPAQAPSTSTTTQDSGDATLLSSDFNQNRSQRSSNSGGITPAIVLASGDATPTPQSCDFNNGSQRPSNSGDITPATVLASGDTTVTSNDVAENESQIPSDSGDVTLVMPSQSCDTDRKMSCDITSTSQSSDKIVSQSKPDTEDITPSQTDAFENGSQEISDTNLTTKQSTEIASTSDSGQTTPNPRKRKLSTCKQDDKPLGTKPWQRETLEKPRLLTLNPFCIPVALLKFKPTQT